MATQQELLSTFALVLVQLFGASIMMTDSELLSDMRFGYDRAVDLSGNIFVVSAAPTGKSGCRYAIAKYNKKGERLWGRQGAQIECISGFFAAIAVDRRGNAYVVERVPISSPPKECDIVYIRSGCVTSKYDATGTEVWTARSDASYEDAIDPGTIALGDNGDVCVAGTTAQEDVLRHPSEVSENDILVKKYDSEGHLTWSARYDGPAGKDDWPNKAVIDAKGNVYLAGTTREAEIGGQFVTIKYDPSGTLLWARYYTPGKRTFTAGAESLIVDERGDVYVVGNSMRREDRRMQIITVKYNKNGEQQWVASYCGDGKEPAGATEVGAAGDGGVYIGGCNNPSARRSHDANAVGQETCEFVIIRYDAAGKEQWVARYETPLDAKQWISQMKVDRAGEVYLIAQIGSEAAGEFRLREMK
ncbi:MAG: hypothetical protein ACYTBJ_22045 [Planctomycetota bacterium]|jgi:hypothetical protein